MLKNLSRLTLVSKNQFMTPITRSISDKLFKNVLNSPDLINLRNNLESMIQNKPEYIQITDDIYKSRFKTEKSKFITEEVNLRKKLNFKLACIILSFKRLTSAFENDFLDDYTKIDLVKEIIFNDLKNKSPEDTEEQLDLLDLLGLNVNDHLEDDDEIAIEMESFFYGEDTENIKMDLFLTENAKISNPIIEYTEDIVQSISNEIEEKASDLRTDFPNIDKHIKDLQVLITTEWLDDYKERYLDATYDKIELSWDIGDGADPKYIV